MIEHKRRILMTAKLAACALAMSTLFGCSDDPADEGPQGPAMVVHGNVQGENQGQLSPLSGATVNAWSDADGDGSISEKERFTTESEGEGVYELEVVAGEEATLVVEVRANGRAPSYRTVAVNGQGRVRLDVTLSTIEPLECQGTRCSVQDQSLAIEGLPEGLSGMARVFNPVAEANMFPGDFSDDQGNLLISGVFSIVELEDESGQKVEQLDEPVELSMRMPRDTWSVIVDIESGNDQIDVPLYAFDETRGEWERDGQARLVDANGEVIPESELDQIRSGDYQGVVVASGDVDHFSAWNVDWPVESHTSVRGCLKSGDSAAQGAAVTARGVSYDGTSRTQTVDDEGCFCTQVMRSEQGGEDIDQNGQPGDTHSIVLNAVYDGDLYDLGVVELPTEQATCDDETGGEDMGTIELNDDNRLHAAVCEFTIEVRDIDGAPFEGATAYAFGSSIDYELHSELCVDQESGEYICRFGATTDANGRATVSTPILGHASVGAHASDVNPDARSSRRHGRRMVIGCPDDVVNISLNEGFDQFELDVSFDGSDQISWSPDIDVDLVSVSSEGFFAKWAIYSENYTISPPVTYGQVPSGAEQTWPIDNATPEAIEAGDHIYVNRHGVSDDGIPEWHRGSFQIPE